MLRKYILICLVATGWFGERCVGADAVSAVDKPDVSNPNAFYVSNREPLQPNPLVKLPIRAIQPRGWLRKQLQLQAAGFHGHLEEISKFLKKDKNAWLDPKGEGERGWEEVPYWLKGYSNCAYTLGDEEMVKKAKIWIEGALSSRKPDGWFGPDRKDRGTAARIKGREDLWPNMIMLFCLQDYYDYTGDQRVIDLMKGYFRYLHGLPESKLLLGYWPKMRGGDQLFSIYWLYNRTGEPWLLELAQRTHRRTARWHRNLVSKHNVNISQAFGQPTTYWMQSGNPANLKASYRNFDKIRATHGQMPGGMFAGDENCRRGKDDPRQAVETCGIIEMMLSQETLTWITGDLVWADRCEDVAFNSLPAALTADMKALRYLTAANLAVSDRKDRKRGFQNEGSMVHMNPHDHRCCQHNWGHGWPYFAQHAWFATPDNGLAAVFYGENKVTAKVGNGQEVTIEQRTHYPFDEQATFVVGTKKEVAFPLYLRVPGWCRAAAVKINGAAAEVKAKPGQYIRISRTWKNGDAVSLALPMQVAIRRWDKNHGCVSVDRGPLTYSLKIGEKYVRNGGTDKWPAWEILPTTPWNFGLVLDEKNPAGSFEVAKKKWPANDMPFTHEGAPIEITAKGRKIPQWQLDKYTLVAELQDSPVKSDQPVETITLIPMGAARLRISAFPVIGSGPDARQWKPPKK